jgi:hypothetical protein
MPVLSVRIRGLGPFYVATERNSTEPRHLSRAWITEMAPPYRKGHGWRLRLGRYAVQVGTCTKHPEMNDDHLLDHLGWRGFDWRPGRPPGEGDAQGPGDDEVQEAKRVAVRCHSVGKRGHLQSVPPPRWQR